jgi:hypothetical protein
VSKRKLVFVVACGLLSVTISAWAFAPTAGYYGQPINYYLHFARFSAGCFYGIAVSALADLIWHQWRRNGRAGG